MSAARSNVEGGRLRVKFLLGYGALLVASSYLVLAVPAFAQSEDGTDSESETRSDGSTLGPQNSPDLLRPPQGPAKTLPNAAPVGPLNSASGADPASENPNLSDPNLPDTDEVQRSSRCRDGNSGERKSSCDPKAATSRDTFPTKPQTLAPAPALSHLGLLALAAVLLAVGNVKIRSRRCHDESAPNTNE